jgi:hypothetical protein
MLSGMSRMKKERFALLFGTVWLAIQTLTVSTPAAAPEGSQLPAFGGPARTAKEVSLCRAEEEFRVTKRNHIRIPPPAAPVSLRSRAKNLSQKEFAASQKKWNFFNEITTPKGCFINSFTANENGTVTDSATGLLWDMKGSKESLEYDSALGYIKDLNRTRLAGFTDWRLPTSEEISSLMETATGSDPWHIDPRMFYAAQSSWTSDSTLDHGLIYQWSCDAVTANCVPFYRYAPPGYPDLRDRHNVRAVRSLVSIDHSASAPTASTAATTTASASADADAAPSVSPDKAHFPGKGGPSRTPQEASRCRMEEVYRVAKGNANRVPPPPKPTLLRSKPANLSLEANVAFLEKGNFYSVENRPWGCFVNSFTRNSDGTVTDSATGLMWESKGSAHALGYDSARLYVRELNLARFAGRSDWRIPTSQEWASLMEAVPDASPWHIDTLLFRPFPTGWSSDSLVDDGKLFRWNCSPAKSDCHALAQNPPPDAEGLNAPHHVRAVRSLSR